MKYLWFIFFLSSSCEILLRDAPEIEKIASDVISYEIVQKEM